MALAVPDGNPEAMVIDSPLTCLVADDSVPLREAMVDFLAVNRIEVLGVAGTGVQLLRLVDRLRPSVVLLDVRLPDIDGVDLARRVTELARAKPAVILHTSELGLGLVPRALDAGARAVVIKGGSPQKLIDAISEVTAGGIYIDPLLTRSSRCRR
jgi:DNA-binding NarL/FixJ family response regulator